MDSSACPVSARKPSDPPEGGGTVDAPPAYRGKRPTEEAGNTMRHRVIGLALLALVALLAAMSPAALAAQPKTAQLGGRGAAKFSPALLAAREHATPSSLVRVIIQGP